jgi:hypothetical protein
MDWTKNIVTNIAGMNKSGFFSSKAKNSGMFLISIFNFPFSILLPPPPRPQTLRETKSASGGPRV